MNDRKRMPTKKIISQILLDLKEQKYAEYTIYRYQLCYERLLEFMEQRGEQFYHSGIGIEYIQEKFGVTIEGLFGTHPPELRETIRALQVLWDYSEYGTVVIKLRPKHKPFEPPDGFKSALDAFETDHCQRAMRRSFLRGREKLCLSGRTRRLPFVRYGYGKAGRHHRLCRMI